MQNQKNSASLDTLLERAASQEYIQGWQQALLSAEKRKGAQERHPYVCFALQQEYFALSALVIGEITVLRAVHRLPHVKVPFIDGLVNVNGRLKMLVSMETFLPVKHRSPTTRKIGAPLILVEKDLFTWTFMVHEVLGLIHITPDMLQKPPMTNEKLKIKGLLFWKGRSMRVLDEESLMLNLEQALGKR